MANEEEQQKTADEILDELYNVISEMQEDKTRLNRLYVQGDLNQVSTLAGEVVQSMYSSLLDVVQLQAESLTEMHDAVGNLEESSYTQTPRTMRLLVSILEKRGSLSAEETARLRDAIGEEDEVQSVLTTEDSREISAALKSYKVMLEETNADLEYRAKIHGLIRRVKEITVDGEDESDSGAEDATASSAPASEPENETATTPEAAKTTESSAS